MRQQGCAQHSVEKEEKGTEDAPYGVPADDVGRNVGRKQGVLVVRVHGINQVLHLRTCVFRAGLGRVLSSKFAGAGKVHFKETACRSAVLSTCVCRMPSKQRRCKALVTRLTFSMVSGLPILQSSNQLGFSMFSTCGNVCVCTCVCARVCVHVCVHVCVCVFVPGLGCPRPGSLGRHRAE